MKEETYNNFKILTGCFIITVLINGTARLSSIYFVESITRYNVNRQQASFPFFLTYMMKNVAGPLIGYLEQILGTKWIIMIGGLMATFGIGGCFFAEDIWVISLLWGLVLGLSFAFSTNMLAPLLNQCFIKSKSKANGFVSAGSCVGGVLLPAIMSACIDSFGTSGSFLILSAIIANTLPASLLIHYSCIKPKYATLKENELNTNNSAINSDDSNTCKCFQSFVVENESSKNPTSNNCSENVINHLKETRAYNSFFPCPLHTEKFTEDKNKYKNDLNQSHKKFTLRHFRIFFNKAYIIILLINGLNGMVITVIWTIILDFVKDKGVSENLEIYYVILLPITDLFGRIGSGFVLDKAVLTLKNFCLVTFIVETVTITVIVFLNNYILLMVCEMLISLCIGITLILEIALTHEFVEEDTRKMAMSCRVALYAPISFAISPMIGYFRGGYGSYDNIFYILGIISLFCGCASYLLPHLAKSRRSF